MSQSLSADVRDGSQIYTYNVPCLMFFSISGLVLQIPVFYTHCGLFSRPNVPVLVMSLCYMYVMASTTVAAAYWNNDNPSSWWNGAGWCDIDVRLYMAVSLAILSAQCAINWNLGELLADRPKLIFGRRALVKGIIELIVCLFIPIVNLAVSTFFMYARYGIVQDLGCTAVTDTSVALLMTYIIWIPLLGAGAIGTMAWISYRFWKCGRVYAMESVSFMPHMNASQFGRFVLFSVTVTMILVPLIIIVAIIDLLNMANTDDHSIAWAHGKPHSWNSISLVTLYAISKETASTTKVTVVVNFVIRYFNVVIAWLLFLCYGTGSLAKEAYTTALYFILPIRKCPTKPSRRCIVSEPHSPDSRFSFNKGEYEWGSEIDDTLEQWALNLKSRQETGLKVSSKFTGISSVKEVQPALGPANTELPPSKLADSTNPKPLLRELVNEKLLFPTRDYTTEAKE